MAQERQTLIQRIRGIFQRDASNSLEEQGADNSVIEEADQQTGYWEQRGVHWREANKHAEAQLEVDWKDHLADRLQYARENATGFASEVWDADPDDLSAALRAEGLTPDPSAWGDPDRIVASVEAEARALAEQRGFDMGTIDGQLQAYEAVGTAYENIANEIALAAMPEPEPEGPQLAHIGDWRLADGVNKEYRELIVVTGQGFHPAYEVSHMGGEGDISYSEVAFPTVDAALAVNFDYYQHDYYGGEDKGFREHLSERGLLPESSFSMTDIEEYEVLSELAEMDQLDERGIARINELEDAFQAGITLAPEDVPGLSLVEQAEYQLLAARDDAGVLDSEEEDRLGELSERIEGYREVLERDQNLSPAAQAEISRLYALAGDAALHHEMEEAQSYAERAAAIARDEAEVLSDQLLSADSTENKRGQCAETVQRAWTDIQAMPPGAARDQLETSFVNSTRELPAEVGEILSREAPELVAAVREKTASADAAEDHCI